jgi:hypothetical protein
MELLGNGLVLVLAGVVIWGLWRASLPPRLFVVRIVSARPTPAVGTVTPAFLRQVGEIAAEYGVDSGQVCGVACRGGQVRLVFSGQFPESARQRLRNWWAVSGWRAGRRRG